MFVLMSMSHTSPHFFVLSFVLGCVASEGQDYFSSFCPCLCRLVHGEDNNFLAESLNRTEEILTGKHSNDLHTLNPSKHKIVAHSNR